MNKYKKANPYHVWAYTKGRKFVVHFKNKSEATKWGKTTNTRIGKVTTASKTKKRRFQRPLNPFGGRSFF